jgi:hypothetical protein
MILSVTGSRHGMTARQATAFRELLRQWRPAELHHGDCRGVDDQACTICAVYQPVVPVRVAHPPTNAAQRAFCGYSTHELAPRSYEQRNAALVAVCTILAAFPRLTVEQRRGGTWMTVRMARAVRRWHVIVWPDGSLQEHPFA